MGQLSLIALVCLRLLNCTARLLSGGVKLKLNSFTRACFSQWRMAMALLISRRVT